MQLHLNHPEGAASAQTGNRSQLAVFASVKLTIVSMTLIAITVLVGAWCPQESQVGQEKVIEMFGPDTAVTLTQWGITDIFHSPWFLALIGLLTVNMVACSVQRVFPKVKLLKLPMPWLKVAAIAKLPFNVIVSSQAASGQTVLAELENLLKKGGYKVKRSQNMLVAESGKYGRLAATVTHIGLLLLLASVTVTSWTGFSGFQPVLLGKSLSFEQSEHSKLWIGKLPKWRVRVDATRRENYQSGDAKQWYSDLTVIDEHGKALKSQQISVNNPLSYDGVDIYQSSWGLDRLVLTFGGSEKVLQLRPMGKLYAAFLPLNETTILIMSVRDQTSPLRISAKIPEWQAPKLVAQVPLGKSIDMGGVAVGFKQVLPVSGLQYKCDPALAWTYTAFGFITLGVMMAAVPFKQVWACAESSDSQTEFRKNEPVILYIGGRSVKARTAFESWLLKTAKKLGTQVVGEPQTNEPHESLAAGQDSTEESQLALASK